MKFEKRTGEYSRGAGSVTWGAWETVAEGNVSGSQLVQITESKYYQFRLKVRNTLGGESDWSTIQEIQTNIYNQPPIDLFIIKTSGGAGYYTFDGYILMYPRNTIIKKLRCKTNMTYTQNSSASWGWSNQDGTKVRLRTTNPATGSSTYHDLRVNETYDVVMTTDGTGLGGNDYLYLQATISIVNSTAAAWGLLFEALGENDQSLGVVAFQFGKGILTTSDATLNPNGESGSYV